jgi:hypothetical protein
MLEEMTNRSEEGQEKRLLDTIPETVKRALSEHLTRP